MVLVRLPHRLTVNGLVKPLSLCASSSHALAAVWLLLLCSFVASGLRPTGGSLDLSGGLNVGRTLVSTPLLSQSAQMHQSALIRQRFRFGGKEIEAILIDLFWVWSYSQLTHLHLLWQPSRPLVFAQDCC